MQIDIMDFRNFPSEILCKITERLSIQQYTTFSTANRFLRNFYNTHDAFWEVKLMELDENYTYQRKHSCGPGFLPLEGHFQLAEFPIIDIIKQSCMNQRFSWKQIFQTVLETNCEECSKKTPFINPSYNIRICHICTYNNPQKYSVISKNEVLQRGLSEENLSTLFMQTSQIMFKKTPSSFINFYEEEELIYRDSENQSDDVRHSFEEFFLWQDIANLFPNAFDINYFENLSKLSMLETPLPIGYANLVTRIPVYSCMHCSAEHLDVDYNSHFVVQKMFFTPDEASTHWPTHFNTCGHASLYEFGKFAIDLDSL